MYSNTYKNPHLTCRHSSNQIKRVRVLLPKAPIFFFFLWDYGPAGPVAALEYNASCLQHLSSSWRANVHHPMDFIQKTYHSQAQWCITLRNTRSQQFVVNVCTPRQLFRLPCLVNSPVWSPISRISMCYSLPIHFCGQRIQHLAHYICKFADAHSLGASE